MRAGEGFFKGGPLGVLWGGGLDLTRCPMTATDTVVNPPNRPLLTSYWKTNETVVLLCTEMVIAVRRLLKSSRLLVETTVRGDRKWQQKEGN